MHISEPGYERPRRACQPCAAHIAAGEYSCNARYALAIATPGADMYHRQAAVRHLSAAMEDAAKNAVKSAGGGADGGGILGPLSAIQRVHGGTPAVFEALVPMMSTEVSTRRRYERGAGGAVKPAFRPCDCFSRSIALADPVCVKSQNSCNSGRL